MDDLVPDFLLADCGRDEFKIDHHLADGHVERMGKHQTKEVTSVSLPGFGEGAEADVRGEHGSAHIGGARKKFVILEGGAFIGLRGEDIDTAFFQLDRTARGTCTSK